MKKGIHFLLPFGLVLIVCALIGLYSGPNLMQYAFLPEGTLPDLQESMENVRSELPGYTLSLHAVKNGASVSTEDGGKSQSDVVLYMAGARYSECYPQRVVSGRPLTYADVIDKEHSIVLDEKLAFQLFGDKDPLDGRVTVGDKTYTVVGTVKHTRRIGEIGTYAAWIPLSCAEDETSCDVAVLTAVANGGSDMSVLFSSAAQNNLGSGTLYNLAKERMRATMALRLIAMVVVIRLLVIWVRLIMKLGARWLGDFQAKLKDRYMTALIGYAAVRVLAMLAIIAATLTACWGLMTFFIQPVKVFTEWVPEVIVSFSSIQGRFWELCAEAAKPVSCMTADMAELRFFAAFLRWGVIFALIGLAMTLITRMVRAKRS